jgi:hypothetical protein
VEIARAYPCLYSLSVQNPQKEGLESFLRAVVVGMYQPPPQKPPEGKCGAFAGPFAVGLWYSFLGFLYLAFRSALQGVHMRRSPIHQPPEN